MKIAKHLALGLLLICAGAKAQTSNLTIKVSSLKNDTGALTAELYNSKDNFLKKAYKRATTTIKSNTAGLSISGIPKGEYTVLVYHDLNKNGKLDKNFVGMPKEPVACSNDAKGFMGPPKYEDAKFTINGDTQISIKMSKAH